jgi:hypothetical protein
MIGISLLLIVFVTGVALLLAIPMSLAFSQLASSGSNNTNQTIGPLNNYTNEKSFTQFLTDDDMSKIAQEMNYKIIPVSNTTLGDVNNFRASTVGNTTYVAWQGNITNTNHVFISITYNGGANYTEPLELTMPNANASELQLFASNNTVSLVWFDRNQTAGNSSIFGSRSTDSGQHFSTFRLTFLNTTATDLMLPTHTVVLWIQKGGCGDGGPVPPTDNTLPTSSIVQHAGKIVYASAVSSEEEPYILCMHHW